MGIIYPHASAMWQCNFFRGEPKAVELTTAVDENVRQENSSRQAFPNRLIALKGLSDISSVKSPEQKPEKALGSRGIRCELPGVHPWNYSTSSCKPLLTNHIEQEDSTSLPLQSD